MTYLKDFWARERELMATPYYWVMAVSGFIWGALLSFWVPWVVSVALVPLLLMGIFAGINELDKAYIAASWRVGKDSLENTSTIQDSRLFGGLAITLALLGGLSLFTATPVFLRAFLLGSFVMLGLRWVVLSNFSLGRFADFVLDTIISVVNTSAEAVAHTWGRKPVKVEEPPKAEPPAAPPEDTVEAETEPQPHEPRGTFVVG